MPRTLRSPVASGSTRRAAKCFGSKRGRRALQTAPALPDFQFLDRQRRNLHRVMDTSLRDLDDRLSMLRFSFLMLEAVIGPRFTISLKRST